jgi:hypothetical protein
MDGRNSLAIGALAAALILSAFEAGCSRQAAPALPSADASGLVEMSMRVPAALSVVPAPSTLSVVVDPASLGEMEVTAHAGTVVGVETDVFVFRQGEDRPVLERRGIGKGADFEVASNTWSTSRDGVPAPGTKYVVEVQFVLFETDVPAAKEWDPHAGSFRPLWRGTLRQAEE